MLISKLQGKKPICSVIKLEGDLSGTRTVLNIISVILCIFSGISIMSITFFSVKERIPEIGIRKAFGANGIDIAFQFVFEMVIIAFFVSVAAVCISFLGCKLTENYITMKMYIPFSVSVENRFLLLPVLAGMLEAMLSSIIPSLYAARIKITDALRFE